MVAMRMFVISVGSLLGSFIVIVVMTILDTAGIVAIPQWSSRIGIYMATGSTVMLAVAGVFAYFQSRRAD